MALVHDSTAKDLIKASPRSWLCFPCPNIAEDCPIQVEDSDVSHISAATDAVIQVFDPEPWIAHFEFYSSREPELERKIVGYHGALHRRWGCWIDCTVFLLRSEANVPGLDGVVKIVHPLDSSRQFHAPYRLIRVWTLETEEFLEGGLGTLPLAILAKGSTRKTAASVWSQVHQRVEQESATDGQARVLLTATKTLMGLRFDASFVERATAKMINLEDSSVVQAVIQRHRAQALAEERRAMISRLGRRRFGELSATDAVRLEGIADAQRLDRIVDRILDAVSWKDLLKTR